MVNWQRWRSNKIALAQFGGSEIQILAYVSQGG
jgi:hypothetical protein